MCVCVYVCCVCVCICVCKILYMSVVFGNQCIENLSSLFQRAFLCVSLCATLCIYICAFLLCVYNLYISVCVLFFQ